MRPWNLDRVDMGQYGEDVYAVDAHQRQEKHEHALPEFRPPVPAIANWTMIPPQIPPLPASNGETASGNGATSPEQP